MRKLAEQTAKSLDTPLMRDDRHWPKPPYENITKCGVLPYRMIDGKAEYYLFKPAGDKPELGDPGFQIPKGTREIFNGDEWEDYKNKSQLASYGAENLETVKVTALREGIEEIGLPVEAIEKAGDWGVATFISASKGTEKAMWLYPLQMNAGTVFNEPDVTHANTVARQWLNINNREQANQIRPDHLQVIREIDRVISKELSQSKGFAK